MEKTSSHPCVSVIIPLYNGQKTIREALESVLAQDYENKEILVIDDGSNDQSAEIVCAYSTIHYIRQENKGVAAARMHGIAHAKGDLIAFLDQDDYWPKNKLSIQVNAFKKDPNCMCVIGKAHFFCEGGVPKNFKREKLSRDELSYLPGVIMAKKTLFRRFPFSTEFKNGSDTDWFVRIQEAQIPIKKLENVLLNVRIHETNDSHKEEVQYGELLKVLKGSLMRKREKAPLISVIIPVYNGEAFLKNAVESVLMQTYSNIEVIIIDDGSTDNTKKIVKRFKDSVTYLYQENGGIGSARNLGIKQARGEYLAFLDADDEWPKEKLEIQMQAFQKEPDLEFLFGKVEHFFAEKELEGKFRPPPETLSGFVAGTLLARKPAVDRLGLFKTEFQVGEFIEWCLRAKQMGMKMGVIADKCLKRRIHGKNTTLQNRGSYHDYLRIIQKYKGVSFELQPVLDKS